MRAQPLPPLSILNKLFRYFPETGKLEYRANWQVCEGKYAGSQYYQVRINTTLYLVHRICWKIHYQEEPPGEIDHENNNKLENTVVNMRAATHAQNIYNRLKQQNNTSGFKGVSWHKQRQMWRAYIVKDYRQKHLGLFDTREAAHAAYCAAASEIAKEFANGG